MNMLSWEEYKDLTELINHKPNKGICFYISGTNIPNLIDKKYMFWKNNESMEIHDGASYSPTFFQVSFKGLWLVYIYPNNEKWKNGNE